MHAPPRRGTPNLASLVPRSLQTKIEAVLKKILQCAQYLYQFSPFFSILPFSTTIVKYLIRCVCRLKMSETVEKCATLLANYHGSNPPQYFAIRFYGECWTNDNSDDLRYDIFGKAYNCYMGTGGSSSNYVYQLASNGT